MKNGTNRGDCRFWVLPSLLLAESAEGDSGRRKWIDGAYAYVES